MAYLKFCLLALLLLIPVALGASLTIDDGEINLLQQQYKDVLGYNSWLSPTINSASEDYAQYYTSDKLIDADTRTLWITEERDDAYILFDLGSAKTVEKLWIYWWYIYSQGQGDVVVSCVNNGVVTEIDRGPFESAHSYKGVEYTLNNSPDCRFVKVEFNWNSSKPYYFFIKEMLIKAT